MLNENENIVFTELKNQGFTIEQIAAIMGVVGGESNFKIFKEIGYSTTDNNRIRAIFPTKFGNLTDPEINNIKSTDYSFFNYVYGGMYGNAPDEGFKYVGRGFNGITFKNNYQNIKNKIGIDVVSNPELLERPEIAAKALAAYFEIVKTAKTFDDAYKLAYRQNAGIGNTWEFYSTTSNPVHAIGTKTKRQKAESYLNQLTSVVPGISNRTLFFFIVDSCSNNIIFSEKIQTTKSNKDLIDTINNIL